jgi:hypoxia up-regulated 1
MPPHGRRRAAPLSYLLFLAYFALQVTAASSVLGIDLGTEYHKAVLVKPGIPLDIVLTKDSKRKEAAALAFKPVSTSSNSAEDVFPERFYGGDALALAARFPGDVYSNLKPLLGIKTMGSPLISQFSKRYPGLQIKPCDSGSTCIKSATFAATEDGFTIEELLGMQLQNIKANADNMAGKGNRVKDAVITIPVFFTAEEKRAVQAAAELAGLNVLGLTTDGLAVGLNYATSRTFPVVNEGGKPEYHLVYDMGAGSATATIMKFQGKVVKDIGRYNKTIQEIIVTGAGWDRTLGGDALNSLILEDMVSKLADHKQIKAIGASVDDIASHGRTIAKMWKEAERMRQVLSANSETQSSFESLYDEDVNFRYKITRTAFEEMAASFDDRVKFPVLQALEAAKLEISELDSIILHGGATRTPFIQKTLESLIGKAEKVRNNVNSDEAAAFGAAFKGASLSASFRVKEIRTNETAVFPVTLSWVTDGKEKNQKLFIPTSTTGFEKQIPLRLQDDFSFTLSQQVSDGVDSTRAIPISRISTKNLTASVKELNEKYGCEATDVTTQFTIRLSSIDGLPEVIRGSVSCETLETKKGGVVDGVKGLFGFGNKKDGQESSKDEPDEGFIESQTETIQSETSSTASESATAKAEEKPKALEKKKVVIHVGFVTETIGNTKISGPELQKIKSRMKAFDTSDKDRKKREEALNSLESYTYKVRDMIEDEKFIAASTNEIRSEIESKGKSASEWLYGDGASAKTAEFKARLKELEDLVNPIVARKEEIKQRPGLIDGLKTSLEQTKSMVKALKDSAAKASQAAAEASASAEKSASEASATPSVADELDALDDEPVTTASPAETLIPEMPLYAVEDLDHLTSSYQAVESWLEEKIAAQSKLKDSDEPVLKAKDLTSKAEELNRVLIEALSKQVVPPKPKKAKTTKSKSKTSSSKKTKSTVTATTATDNAEVTGKDEL